MIKPKRGEIFPQFAGIMAVFMLFVLTFFQFSRANVIVGGLRQALREATISAVNDDKFYGYDSLRQGLQGAYTVSPFGIAAPDAAEDVAGTIDRKLGLSNSNGIHSGNGFSLSGFEVTISNPPARQSGSYMVETRVELEIYMPLKMHINIPLSVSAAMINEF